MEFERFQQAEKSKSKLMTDFIQESRLTLMQRKVTSAQFDRLKSIFSPGSGGAAERELQPPSSTHSASQPVGAWRGVARPGEEAEDHPEVDADVDEGEPSQPGAETSQEFLHSF